MSRWGRRPRVRLHSGGIEPYEVRLRRRGAAERATAPGRDIRDIGPDPGPKICKYCPKPVPNRSRVRCDDCKADDELVTEVRRELARQKLPPLGAPTLPGGPMSKKRRRAEQALERIKKRPKRGGSQKPKKKAAVAPKKKAARAPQVCPECFVLLPSSGQCDECF